MGVAMCILNTFPSDSDGGKEPHFDSHCRSEHFFLSRTKQYILYVLQAMQSLMHYCAFVVQKQPQTILKTHGHGSLFTKTGGGLDLTHRPQFPGPWSATICRDLEAYAQIKKLCSATGLVIVPEGCQQRVKPFTVNVLQVMTNCCNHGSLPILASKTFTRESIIDEIIRAY